MSQYKGALSPQIALFCNQNTEYSRDSKMGSVASDYNYIENYYITTKTAVFHKTKMKIAMNKPELYNASNELQRQSTLKILQENTQHVKWNKIGDTAIDIGCGDGSVSVLVKNYHPHENHRYKKFVASDVNENMIRFAKKRYSNEDITFRVLDIERDLPEDLVGAFNHVFSFYTLHWVKNQEKAFTNVYNLLSDDGDIFITFIASTAIYTIYKILAHRPKWKTWLKDVDVFVSPYHEIQNPEKNVADIVKKCGFKNVDVQCKPYTSVYETAENLKKIVQAVEPFNMPQDVFDEFYKDYYTVGQKLGILNFNKRSNGEAKHPLITYEYTLIIICATK